MPEDEDIQHGADEGLEGDEKDGKGGKKASAASEQTEAEKEEIAEALKIYRGLQGDSAAGIVKALAAQLDLPMGTKEERKEAKDAILEALEEALGEHAFLAPKLAPALKKLFKSHQDEIDGKLAEQTNREISREAEKAITRMTKEFPDFKLFQPTIKKLMAEMDAAEGVSQFEYLRRLYKIAKSDSIEESKRKEKLKLARNDAPGKLQETSVGGDDKKFKSGKDRPSRREAIELAMQQVTAEQDDN